jgi:hypothetical protein
MNGLIDQVAPKERVKPNNMVNILYDLITWKGYPELCSRYVLPSFVIYSRAAICYLLLFKRYTLFHHQAKT